MGILTQVSWPSFVSGGCASIKRAQEEKATNEQVAGKQRGVTQQNQMQFGLMAQNEDSAAQAQRDMQLMTIMKRAELTQKMLEIKMSRWEKMGSGVFKDNIL